MYSFKPEQSKTYSFIKCYLFNQYGDNDSALTFMIITYC